jgi:PEP-CTERM/exosortase A-associated glycosyltransferase
MRILHVLDHSIPLHSGYTFRTLAILQQQRAMGWETFHLTSLKHAVDCPPEEVVDGLHFYRTPPFRGPFARGPVFDQIAVMRALYGRLKEIVQTVRPDIIHAHSPVLNALPALRICRQREIPFVYEVRAFWEDAAVDHGTSREGGLRYRLTRGIETYALKRAHAVTTICQGLRDDIVARGVAPEKITVIPNAVDIGKFSTLGEADMALARRLGLAKSSRVLGFIGSFYAYEGLTLLLEALPRILERLRDVRVLLVGGGPDEARLKEMAQALGIAENVIFVGRVPHDEVMRYYDLVDVLVYPRLSMRLTELVTPLKPLEAMAQGRLVLASDVGGHRELIRDGDNGMLFRAGNADSLASQVVDLLSSPDRWPALRERARRFVETERNWPLSVVRYREVYAHALTAAGKAHE